MAAQLSKKEKRTWEQNADIAAAAFTDIVQVVLTKSMNMLTMKSIANFAVVVFTGIVQIVQPGNTVTVTERTSAFGAVPHHPVETVLTARPESMKNNSYHLLRR